MVKWCYTTTSQNNAQPMVSARPCCVLPQPSRDWPLHLPGTPVWPAPCRSPSRNRGRPQPWLWVWGHRLAHAQGFHMFYLGNDSLGIISSQTPPKSKHPTWLITSYMINRIKAALNALVLFFFFFPHKETDSSCHVRNKFFFLIFSLSVEHL